MVSVQADQVILALDVDTAKEALTWAKRLKGRVGTFKVGLQLFLREGEDVLAGLSQLGVPVFLDLKFHDIPHTVGQAVKAAGRWRPRFMTVHASGGLAMMEAAHASAPQETKILGVTLLTSLTPPAVQEIGWSTGVDDSVQRLSALARKAGLAGVICSPHEAKGERSRWGGLAEIITPGVRPVGSDSQDQARCKTPEEAIAEGASRVVLGRPVLQAPNPEAVLDKILSSDK